MQVDLVGGYYDAGDNVKFGFPMAFTTTVLSWSVIEFGGVMKGELQNAREAICWGTDYVFKATAHPDTIYVQRSDVLKVYVYGVIILLRSTMSYIKVIKEVTQKDRPNSCRYQMSTFSF